MSEERMITVSSLADDMLEMVRCAFIEGFSAGNGGGSNDAGEMAEAWVNSRAYDAVAPGEMSRPRSPS